MCFFMCAYDIRIYVYFEPYVLIHCVQLYKLRLHNESTKNHILNTEEKARKTVEVATIRCNCCCWCHFIYDMIYYTEFFFFFINFQKKKEEEEKNLFYACDYF